MNGVPTLEYNLNIFFRVKELWNHHDKGKAALHFFADAQGIWRTLVQLDGRELWRLGIRGQWHFENPDKVDASAMITEMVGREVPHEVVASLPWVARDLVADRYGAGRVFLAGDAAHQNTPSGGFGLNTGMGDVNDLGWKLAALVQGWGGPRLIDSYEAERRPVAARIVKQATDNFMRDRKRPSHPEIAMDTPAGAEARRAMGAAILESQSKVYLTDGTALGQVYDDSPIVCDDGTPAACGERQRIPADHASRRPRAACLARRRPLDARSVRARLHAGEAWRRCAGLVQFEVRVRVAARAAFRRVARRSGDLRTATNAASCSFVPTATSPGAATRCPPIRSRSSTACDELQQAGAVDARDSPYFFGGDAANCEPRTHMRPRGSCQSFSVACRWPMARATVRKL